MTATIDRSARILAKPDILQSAVRDEAVLLQFGSGEYFGLNAVGVRIWALLQTERTFGELVEVVVEEYEVTAAVAAADLTTMVRDLERHGLIELRDGA